MQKQQKTSTLSHASFEKSHKQYPISKGSLSSNVLGHSIGSEFIILLRFSNFFSFILLIFLPDKNSYNSVPM